MYFKTFRVNKFKICISSEKSCLHNGIIYKSGEFFEDYCNDSKDTRFKLFSKKCHCFNGEVECLGVCPSEREYHVLIRSSRFVNESNDRLPTCLVKIQSEEEFYRVLGSSEVHVLGLLCLNLEKEYLRYVGNRLFYFRKKHI